jgi:ribonuclease P protein component
VTASVPPAGSTEPVAGGPSREGRDESFPRSHRLTREVQFRTLLARGFRHTTKHLIVHVLVNELGHSRLGLTVPRKVGKAVVRNRVRRRLREAFRRCWRHELPRAADLVVRAQPNASEGTFDELRDEGLAAFAAWARAGFREGGRRPRTDRASS